MGAGSVGRWRALVRRFQYIHLPVSANPSKATHPWTILLSVAKPDDYVIVKLDIDSLHVERALVFQLVHNATFNAIVDELYYENHVNTAAMQMHWGMTDDPVRLKHSYALFRALRDVGIRAHSWPWYLNLKCVILYIVCFESKIEKRFVFANRVFVRGPHRRQRLQTRDESRFERSQAPQPKQIKNEASNQHGSANCN
jgi:hypothetical protein